MRKPLRSRQGGYLLITDPNGGSNHHERDTYSCLHCNRIVEVEPFCRPEDMGRRCGGCDGLLCKRCSAVDGCSHIEKRMERIEKREHWRKTYGMVTG